MAIELSKEQAMAEELRRVVVKFMDDIRLPYVDGAEKYLEGNQQEVWQKLSDQFPGITLKRMFTTISPEEINALVTRAKEYDKEYQPPNFLSYFVIEGKERSNLIELADQLQVQENFVEVAYLDPIGVEPFITAVNNPEFVNQGYLQPAASIPPGIDALDAWKKEIAGKNARLIDFERAWALPHSDLIQTPLLFGSNNGPLPEHGINVLGILGALDDTSGCVGICPQVELLGLISYNNDTRPNALMTALPLLQPGDTLLLEVQLIDVPGPFSDKWLPMEIVKADFAMIQLISALKITVIEAAGNGGCDLDEVTAKLINHPRYNHLNGDSKAVMVGAANVISEPVLGRWNSSNYGSRVNCFAWAENIRTLSANDHITGMIGLPDFGGTSGASAIVAGAAALIQSAADPFFFPVQIRNLLSFGTSSNDPATDRIGTMPDLAKILQQIE